MSREIHAGGAATYGLLHSPMHGVSVMKAVLSRWLELDLTQVGSVIAIAGVLPSAWRFVHHVWHEATSWIRRFFVASVTIPGRDPLNRNVADWVLANVIEPRSLRFLTARTQAGRESDRAALLKKTRRAVQYHPHWGTIWFWHEGHLFFVSRAVDDFNASMSDPAYDGVGGEELTVICLGRSVEPIKQFIQTAREFAERQTQYFVIIYARDRYGVSWQPKSRKPIRLLETVHFDEQVKQELLTDIRNYLDPKTAQLYQRRSMPYRRGYLFHGPPGTGKSSLSTALAGEFGLDLYEVNIPTVASDADLEQMFQEIPPQCIVLLEDIDAVWTGRDIERSEYSSGSAVSGCTLSGLLNVLDGVGSQEGRIVIMTTNRPEYLDGALVRPGRVDMKIFLGNISQTSSGEMFVRMFAPEVRTDQVAILESGAGPDMDRIRQLAAEFAAKIPEDTFTPSQLQGFFQLHLEDAEEAAASIDAWVDRHLSKKHERDFELVNGDKASQASHDS